MILKDGKEIRNRIEDTIHTEVTQLRNEGATLPHLVVIQVGDSPQSNKYVNNKKVACGRVGIKCTVLNLSEDTTEEQLKYWIELFNATEDVHGVMLQLPVVSKYIEPTPQHILDMIKPEKDVDGLSTHSMGSIITDNVEGARLYPCTAKGVLDLIYANVNYVRGKNVLVIGKGLTSGRPLTNMLMMLGANVTNISSACTENDRIRYIENSDIIVSCVGRPDIIKPDMIFKSGAFIVNVGMHVVDNKLKGDYDPNLFNHYSDITMTSIINSTGILTVAHLLQNTLHAYKLQNK